MISVPAGRFQRDGTAANISEVSAFRMSQHEVTRAQFHAIIGAEPSNSIDSIGTSDPVQGVNWYHAIAFANKLSLAEGLTPVYGVTGVTDWAALAFTAIPTSSSNATWNGATANWAANGYRLPTEMERMWAAMGAPADGQGGGTNTTGYLKAFAGSTGSNALGDFAWFTGNSGGRTQPVGTRTANELGIFDMSGNVLEWCWDWSGTYPSGTVTDHREAGSGTNRVKRCGAWYTDASTCTVAYRRSTFPNDQYSGLGFRVVRP